MQPQRRGIVNRHVIEEFYWNGRMVTYADNHRVDETYHRAMSRLGGYVDGRAARLTEEVDDGRKIR